MKIKELQKITMTKAFYSIAFIIVIIFLLLFLQKNLSVTIMHWRKQIFR